jgi:hypothetical protein
MQGSGQPAEAGFNPLNLQIDFDPAVNLFLPAGLRSKRDELALNPCMRRKRLAERDSFPCIGGDCETTRNAAGFECHHSLQNSIIQGEEIDRGKMGDSEASEKFPLQFLLCGRHARIDFGKRTRSRKARTRMVKMDVKTRFQS